MIHVGIRADGGAAIGMGHIMRCLSLAKELKRKGYKVYFFSSMKEGIIKIKDEGFDVIVIPQIQSEFIKNSGSIGGVDLEKETDKIIQLIREYHIDLLFIDKYDVTNGYFLKIKPYVKILAYIDDLSQFVYPVDVLINGNITGEYMDYQKYSQDQMMLLGPKYNLIRDEFRDLPLGEIREEAKEILVTTGGSDPYRMSVKIIHMILEDEELRNCIINVIVGNGFINKEELRNIAENNKNIILHENVKKISQIMLKSDIAISAGGSTLYELCACGIPTIAFIMADNQELMVRKMAELGYIKEIGWYHAVEKADVVNAVKKLVQNYNMRKSYSQKGRNLVDARGAEKIVEAITERMQKKFECN
ncbi:UDP-2,4-diacetamido-2,4,6-trideoxy-beta-L-altropyranose hydrolase [Thermotalea metallivorans]|uniref:UDP-2,4-diacetamido-2,4, 6-trideoxy-beta-L-altropyranose hydrolase n=1 Tax=Thermotalea metallivorans TaxID=520762 RepID=A0A140L726_9FIRM|nr:UDP-2,4-diacetamido-2,4,6-trideoxy-beta-L-altropyranose hydrolase [Thermotalea metallivorans]KXG76351.1 UDP-2,4-diacetamido-2,4,6-trideoxy-beta-L-altropyranose hydrolase [Thermotalea metallivorans]